MNKSIFGAACVVATFFLSGAVSATPVEVTHANLPTCDVLSVPSSVEELGVFPFPDDERIRASSESHTVLSCTEDGSSSTMVEIVNDTKNDFGEVWYVADPETTITNVDGLVNEEAAFLIDFVGFNKPLIGESMTPDGVFEAGESWVFIIDSYTNTFGLPASALASVGLVGVASGLDDISSGSIIAVVRPIPIPAALYLFGSAVLVFVRCSRTKPSRTKLRMGVA